MFWKELAIERGLSEIEKGFCTLKPDSARVLKWHYIEGYSLHEIATLIGKSISTVRNHHNRGIFLLHQYFFGAEKKRINSARFS